MRNSAGQVSCHSDRALLERRITLIVAWWGPDIRTESGAPGTGPCRNSPAVPGVPQLTADSLQEQQHPSSQSLRLSSLQQHAKPHAEASLHEPVPKRAKHAQQPEHSTDDSASLLSGSHRAAISCHHDLPQSAPTGPDQPSAAAAHEADSRTPHNTRSAFSPGPACTAVAISPVWHQIEKVSPSRGKRKTDATSAERTHEGSSSPGASLSRSSNSGDSSSDLEVGSQNSSLSSTESSKSVDSSEASQNRRSAAPVKQASQKSLKPLLTLPIPPLRFFLRSADEVSKTYMPPAV